MGLVVCIGAGPAGLTAGYTLAKQRREVLVLEADPQYVGGISRTVQHNGFCFDIGGHRFFSKSAEVVALWKEILGDDLLTRSRKSRIFYGGKFYPYPLNLVRTLANLGVIESSLSILSYCSAKLNPYKNPENLEQWVTNQFGARLFRTFFKTYTEKVWGVACTEISADWAAQRIKGLSLSAALGNAIKTMLGWKNKKPVIKTLIESFYYPRKGPGMMWEAAAQKITAMGGQVQMGCAVKSLAYDRAARQWRVEYHDALTGEQCVVMAEHVISSMPLAELVCAVDGAPPYARHAASQLKYRDFIIVALIAKASRELKDNWIYVHDASVKVGRIQNFKAWSDDMVPDPAFACYGMEYFCFKGDGLWNSPDEALVALATEELASIGLAGREEIVNGVVIRQPKAYPVYDRDYLQHVAVIRAWLAEACPNLQVAGRNGMHKYNNQDHSMMTALLAAKNILAGQAAFDVWQVNQDAEYLEKHGSGASGERWVPRQA